MNKTTLKKIIEHPDKDEIISKLIIGISSKDIYDWLSAKYSNVNEAKFIISEKSIKSFKDNYLDIYSLIKEDLAKTKVALANSAEDDLNLSISNLPAYKKIVLKTVNEELDIRKIIKQLCFVIEHRLAQVFDEIEENPRDIDPKVDKVLTEYALTLSGILEKYHKFTEAPADHIVQNNVTLNVVDQHSSIFHDIIKNILCEIDVDASLYFVERYNQEMSKVKFLEKDAPVTSEVRLTEAKLLSQTINEKISKS